MSDIDKSFRLSLPEPVPNDLYRRHLGMPPQAALSERLVSLAEQARTAFELNADPWAVSREVGITGIDGDQVELSSGHRLQSPLIACGLRTAGAESLLVIAFTAGLGIDQLIAQHWENGRPDEAMFLNAFTIAFVEHWRDVVAARQCELARESERTLLARYSPGYDGWDLADQSVLFELIAASDPYRTASEKPVSLVQDGCLRPSKSTLTMHGLTRSNDRTFASPDWWNSIAAKLAESDLATTQTSPVEYAFPVKALTKWAAKRLTIEYLAEQQLAATFRFSGTTCANMGRPFEFDFRIQATKEDGDTYRIGECTARPAEEDRGHRAMCAFLESRESFLASFETWDLPSGRTLDEMLQWSPDTSPAGCLCTLTSRDHKWRIVLHTLHYALHNTLHNES